ncbi:MAG TPA: hypothetical protein VN285_07325 [Candidatus Deferrimicrobium sp.]|nr:hypothetical protein [Candidatus Deferrimicrobium sp.]
MVAIDLCFLLNWASEPWWQGLWTSLNTIALVITLIFVMKYTKATNVLAIETHSIAVLQAEEIGLRKRPVVSFLCADQSNFFFVTAIENFSMVHAKARIRVAIEINGRILELTEGHHYAGHRIWHLQAGGPDAPTLCGHLSFPSLLELNNINQYGLDLKSVSARVTVEMWVINWCEDDHKLLDDKNKNPVVEWYWKRGQWIPEVSPV